MKASWEQFIEGERGKPYYVKLNDFIATEYLSKKVYPSRDKIFAAFDMTPFDKVKVVILGQDPYHEPGQAQGLAFYVPKGVKTPPSLINIAKELRSEREGIDASKLKSNDVVVPDLISWAQQGVLLLNATLTVVAGSAMSHRGKGWEMFTDNAIKYLSDNREGLVFMLWGTHAQQKGAVIDRTRHCVIECAHPSPLAARNGFFGSRCFEQCNQYLVSRSQTPIEF